MPRQPETDVLIVGGGVIGLAAAYRAAEAGLSVRLLDASGTRGASWAAAGMLAPASEAVYGEEALTALNVSAVEEFRRFCRALAERSGLDPGLRTEGTVAVAFNADDRAALARLTDYRTSLGLVTQTLSRVEVRRLEPFLAAEVRSGVLAVDDLSVDNRRYVAALTAGCRELGVDLRQQTATELTRASGRVDGARTSEGEHRARAVVVCTGSAAQTLTGLPVLPVKGQIVRLAVPARLAAGGAALQRTIRGVVRGSEVYLVPRGDGEVVVGATVEHQGDDETVTAGGVYELLRNAYELVPITSEFEFVEARAGLRPGTPDNAPILGWLEPGLIAAVGHYRNGILLSASTAAAVTRLLAGGPVARQWEPFSPQRFEG